MTREEKIAMCHAAVEAQLAGRWGAFESSLTDDPAPTRPGDPRALELARLIDSNAFVPSHCDEDDEEQEIVLSWPGVMDDVDEIAAILRRAPSPDLDLIEKYMRRAVRDQCAFQRLGAVESEVLANSVYAMRKELGGK